MKKVLKRLGRSILSLVISGAFVYAKKDPRYIALVPIIQTVGKLLREYTRIPFIIF